MKSYSNLEVARALTRVIGGSKWEAVSLAHGFMSKEEGVEDEKAARAIYEHGPALTLKRSRKFIKEIPGTNLIDYLKKRTRRGSAENPITKMFPATITEQRFLLMVEEICDSHESLSYSDDRHSGHSFTDFTILEGELRIPINIKNAGTKFRKAKELVGLEPEDCIPIPAYKAHGALEEYPNLLYLVSIDYDLVYQLSESIPKLLSEDEFIVWELLNHFAGTQVRNAEDTFIFTMVKKYWEEFEDLVEDNPFHVISARKSIRILQKKPERTPGIGLRAWGTQASAEVNVHLSVKEDTTPWEEVKDRIINRGVKDIVAAVNRKKMEEVYDPEI